MKGIKTGGRQKGVKNAFTYDVKAKLSQNVNDKFVEEIFSDIENIQSPSDRVRARLKIVELFVSKPKDQCEVEQENEFRRIFMERLLPKK